MSSTSLFAPIVRAVQPAFTSGEVKVYFSFSPFNGSNAATKIRYSLIDPNQNSGWGSSNLLKNGTLDSNTGLYYKEVSSWTQVGSTDEYYISFDISKSDHFETGSILKNQFYQVQLWMVSDSEVSQASQATLIRPINSHTVSFPSGDVHELNTISGEISDSVELLLAVSCKVGGQVYEGVCNGQSYSINLQDFPFKEGENYSIDFTYETIHGYTKTETKECKLIAPGSISDTDFGYNKDTVIVCADLDSASVNIEFEITNTTKTATDFIERASEEYEYKVWKKIGDIGANSRNDTNPWRDTTVQSEVKYKYRIARISGTSKKVRALTTKEKIWKLKDGSWQWVKENSETVSVPFEHIVISDKDFLLNLKYNANISGFKYVNQESITNTLGGKYPLVRRNGDTNYIQFNLSGLLHIDCTNVGGTNSDSRGNGTANFFDDERAILYLNDANSQIAFTQSTNQKLIERRAREVITRLLTNGRPKLFRSFEEGNLIVYLSGISFTPNKQLDRHIYDFSATVTQLCDYTFENLNKYNLNHNHYNSFMKSVGLEQTVVNGVFYDGSVTITEGD